MKKILLIALLLTAVLGINAQTGKRMLVTYFSWSGSTKALAEKIQRQTNADIYRIEPLVPYTDDYQTLAYEISNREKEEKSDSAYSETLLQVRGMAQLTAIFGLNHLSFHEKDVARHEYRPIPEYVYNALPFFFPSQNATGIKHVNTQKHHISSQAYNISGIHSKWNGIVIENGKKH